MSTLPRVAGPPRAPLRRARLAPIAGVCAGLAAHLGWKVGWVRTLFLVAVLCSGAGLLMYLWLWVFVPLGEQPAPGPAVVSRRVPVAWIVFSAAVVASLAAVVALLRSSQSPGWETASIVATVLAAAAAGWAGFLDVNDPQRGRRHVGAVQAAASAVIVGVIVLAAVSVNRSASPLTVLLVVLVAVVCLGAVFAPVLIRRFADLSQDRVRRIREEQRSEMAAHLHDSVLQTLALIQHRAGASTEVARIARAQERELRGWLYDGDQVADSDLPTDLRDYAAALELDYPVRIEVVAAGTSAERASGELAAASREAMLNAARHAGGDVSVYIESSRSSVDVFVRDRGAGFDLAAVPADRLGVRQSIIGRMRRAGGSATVRPGAGGSGTEVHLHVTRKDASAGAEGTG